MEKQVQVLSPNTMTLDEHVEKIEVARNKIRSGVFEFAAAIADAVHQLDSMTQQQLAPKLGMTQSTLSRWLDIGSHPVIMSMRDELPATFGTLHDLIRLEKKYVNHYGNKKGNTIFSDVFSKNRIIKNSERSDVRQLLDEVDRKIKAKKVKQNETSILSLGGQQLASPQKGKNTQTINQLLISKSVFRTFVVIPNTEQIMHWGAMDFDTDIRRDYPLIDLRHTSHTDAIQCLIQIPIKDVPTGLMMLSGWGFQYRDMLLPTQKKIGYEIRNIELVVIRGERGRGQLENLHIKEDSLDGVLDYAESIGKSPYLLLGDDTDRADWMICKDSRYGYKVNHKV